MTDRLNHEHEPLWSVEAEVGGDGTVALPRPGGIAFPYWERGERKQTPEEIEQRRVRWGPPRADLDRRLLILTLLALTGMLAAAIAVFGMSLSTDRYLLILFVPALLLRRGRLYLRDFGIFAALIFVYSELRGLAHVLRPDPFYTPQLNLDKWLFAGHVPTVQLQQWFWTGSMQWYDHVIVDTAGLHFIVPPLLAFLLWMKRRGRA